MPRIKINGVIWNRTTDKILKMSDQQYDQELWERVSDRRPGKTPQNCIYRWEGGLNRSCEKVTKATNIGDESLPIVTAHETTGEGSDDTHEDGPDVRLVDARQRLIVQQHCDAERMARYKRFAVQRRQANLRKKRLQDQDILRDEFSSYSDESWYFGYESSGSNDSLADWSSGIHQAEYREPEQPNTFDAFLDELLGNNEPMSERNKVITLPEPSYDCAQYWQTEFIKNAATEADNFPPDYSNEILVQCT